MDPLVKGPLRARLAGPGERGRALALRARVFRGGRADEDEWDAGSHHVLVERDGALAATFRIRDWPAGRIGQSYAGGRYDLTRLSARGGILAEMGRSPEEVSALLASKSVIAARPQQSS